MQRIRLAESGDGIVSEASGASREKLVFDMAYAVRMVSDIIPNAWWAREVVGRLMAGFSARGFSNEKLGELSGLIVEELRRWLKEERNRKAEALFRSEVAAGGYLGDVAE